MASKLLPDINKIAVTSANTSDNTSDVTSDNTSFPILRTVEVNYSLLERPQSRKSARKTQMCPNHIHCDDCTPQHRSTYKHPRCLKCQQIIHCCSTHCNQQTGCSIKDICKCSELHTFNFE